MWQALAHDYFEPRKAHKCVYSETVTQKDTVRKLCGDLGIKSHPHAPVLTGKGLQPGSALRSRSALLVPGAGDFPYWLGLPWRGLGYRWIPGAAGVPGKGWGPKKREQRRRGWEGNEEGDRKGLRHDLLLKYESQQPLNTILPRTRSKLNLGLI